VPTEGVCPECDSASYSNTTFSASCTLCDPGSTARDDQTGCKSRLSCENNEYLSDVAEEEKKKEEEEAARAADDSQAAAEVPE